ncbi:hypothetical protein AAMO2058_001213900 [Amorphochlora amoebiformis]
MQPSNAPVNFASSNPAPNQSTGEGSPGSPEIQCEVDNAQTAASSRESFHPTARNHRLTPQASRANESKMGSETKCNPQGAPEVKFNRIVLGLREMLSRFTVSEEMYVELANIVGRDYRTTGERVQAVQEKLSQWKNAGALTLRTDS